MKFIIFIVIIVILLESNASSSNEPETAIADGSETPNDAEIRFHAHIHMGLSGGNVKVGSGVFIGDYYVVTVAQNIITGIISLRCGFGHRDRRQLTWVEAENYVVHPNYNRTTLLNNIAIIKLVSKPLSVVIQPLFIANSTTDGTGTTGNVFGFGHTNNDGDFATYLKKTSLTIQSDEDCLLTYPHLVGRELSEFCGLSSIGSGICAGDVGGAFVTTFGDKYILTGISSFYYSSDCFSGKSSAFLRVSFFRDWIEFHTGIY